MKTIIEIIKNLLTGIGIVICIATAVWLALVATKIIFILCMIGVIYLMGKITRKGF